MASVGRVPGELPFYTGWLSFQLSRCLNLCSTCLCEEGPVATHTPRRTALKWEPPRTVREEPLALSRKTEAYCPVCREGCPSGWGLPLPTLPGQQEGPGAEQALAGLGLEPSTSGTSSSALPSVLQFGSVGASPCPGQSGLQESDSWSAAGLVSGLPGAVSSTMVLGALSTTGAVTPHYTPPKQVHLHHSLAHPHRAQGFLEERPHPRLPLCQWARCHEAPCLRSSRPHRGPGWLRVPTRSVGHSGGLKLGDQGGTGLFKETTPPGGEWT